jgi:2-polyprenyl-6-methoxyphenol hydroxylase-like FAD-dependent oxidoreductase
MTTQIQSSQETFSAERPGTRTQTTCCIVGGGPGGMVLALALVKQGIDVTLLELHKDFDRDFRGDTVHPNILEVFEQLGVIDKVLRLPHTEARTFNFPTPDGVISPLNFEVIKTRYPYIAIIHQAAMLDTLAQEAARYPNFHLVMGAGVQELIEEEGVVRGVRYRQGDEWREVRALLTVGADGRFSKVRKLAGFEPIKTSPPMDILWFRLPRYPHEPGGVGLRTSKGHLVITLDRGDEYQLGCFILKGSYQEVRAAGLESFRQTLVELEPQWADRVHLLSDWKQLALLNVESNRLPRWYKPGLLLIGDAAHVMSPVGGVGICYAVQDAVAAANLLSTPLKRGQVDVADLARVQRRRELPTRLIQAVQTLAQKRIIANALDTNRRFVPPKILRLLPRLPGLRQVPARLIGFGLRPEHLSPAVTAAFVER